MFLLKLLLPTKNLGKNIIMAIHIDAKTIWEGSKRSNSFIMKLLYYGDSGKLSYSKSSYGFWMSIASGWTTDISISLP